MGLTGVRSSMCALLALFAMLAAPSGAAAHSRLLHAVPAPGASVDDPQEIILEFSEPVVAPADAVRVQDVRGNVVAAGPPVLDGRVVRVPLDDPAAGSHLVEWQMVNDHGSPVKGSFVFHNGAPSQQLMAAGGEPGKAAAIGELADLSRAVALSGLLLTGMASGTAVALRRRRGGRAASLAYGAAGAGVVALLAAGGFLLAGGSGAAEQSAPGIQERVSLGDERMAAVEMSPGVAGSNSISVDVTDASGAPDESVDRAYVRYMPLRDDAAPFRYDLTPDGTGRFVGEDLVVPTAGQWRVRVHVGSGEIAESLVSLETMIQSNPALGWQLR